MLFDGIVPAVAVCDARQVGGCSSAGRAPRSQRGGQRFDPAQLHQRIDNLLLSVRLACLLALKSIADVTLARRKANGHSSATGRGPAEAIAPHSLASHHGYC